MTTRDVEQILLDEQRRLTDWKSSSGSGSLLQTMKALSTIPKSPSTTAEPASFKSLTGTTVEPKTEAASATNKGYTVTGAQSGPPETTTESSVAGEIGKTALTLFTSGFGLMPLISGVAGLFGMGGSAPPPPLVKYAMPRPIQITAANSRERGTLTMADYTQDGTARSFHPAETPGVQGQTSTPAGQIIVNVQAMDSRSFLDHSQEIAEAVRDAMLNMHSINDVVSEL